MTRYTYEPGRDLDLDDYTGECDECDARYIPSHSDDHCTECGNCFDHCVCGDEATGA